MDASDRLEALNARQHLARQCCEVVGSDASTIRVAKLGIDIGR